MIYFQVHFLLKNNIIIKYDKGSTFDYLWIGDGTFIDPDYNEVYKRSEYTSEDYKYVKDYDPVEIQKKEEKRDVIKKNFSVKVTKNKIGEFCTYTYRFERTLEKVYPTSSIEYLICVGDGCSDCSNGQKCYLTSNTGYSFVLNGSTQVSRFINEMKNNIDYLNKSKRPSYLDDLNKNTFNNTKKINKPVVGRVFGEEVVSKNEYRNGTLVEHTAFGEGIVISVEGTNLRIAFKNAQYGVKLISSTFKGLKIK